MGISLVILPVDEWQWTLLMIRRYWIRWWLVTVIACPNVDPDLCHHMASLGHNELTVEVLRYFLGYRRPSIAKGTSIKLVYLCCHHCGSHGLTLGHLQVTNTGECHLSTSITDATDTWAPFQYPIRRLIVAPFQYPTSTVYWCIASKLKAPRNFYWMSNMFLWVEIFIFFVCYHVVPKRHSQLDYELNGL